MSEMNFDPPWVLIVGNIGEEALTALEEAGFAVHITSEGAEALTVLAMGLRPSLMVLDMRAPQPMDRLVLAALKTQELFETPVVILSEVDEVTEDPLDQLFILRALDSVAIRRIIRSALSSPSWGDLRESGELLCQDT